MQTFKALAALLEYPTQEFISALPEIETILANEKILAPADLNALKPLLTLLNTSDVMDLQESYVDMFDRGRATSLNLFEHVHGESRDRGQAMVDLKALYDRHGLELSANQLPDYLPVVLEYLSLRSMEEAREMLGDCVHILQSVGAALARRNSPYAAVLQSLLRLAGEVHAENAIRQTSVEDDSTTEALDRAWVEEPVTFLGSCSPQKPQTSVVHFHKGTRS